MQGAGAAGGDASLRRRDASQIREALAGSAALRELALLARSRLKRYSDQEVRRMLAACLVETLAAMDAEAIQFQGEEARATLNALMLVGVDLLVRGE